MAEQWTEVNIVPAAERSAESVVLLGLVDPLVHDRLSGRIDAWFYFWETSPIGKLHLRLRILWRRSEDDGNGQADMAALLDDARRTGKIERWFEGAHGNEGQVYAGEADLYGPEVWEPTYRFWMSASELALSVIKAEGAGHLTKPRQFHWVRDVHVYSNQLLRSELQLSSLLLARALLPPPDADPDAAAIRGAINGYFKDA